MARQVTDQQQRWSFNMAEAEDEVTWTYTNEEGRYDASLLEDSGKHAFNLLLEVNAEIQTLGKRTTVLQAAAVQLNSIIQGALTDDALIEAVEAAEESEEEED